MADGAKFISDSGKVQIDSQYQNMALWAEGSVSVSKVYRDPCWTWDEYRADIPLPSARSRPPILAVSMAVGNTVGLYALKKDSNGNVTDFVVLSNQSAAVDYQIFIPSDELPTPSDDWGMIIWNGSSQQVFNSAFRYMNLTNVFSGGPSNHGPFTHDALSPPYFILGTHGGLDQVEIIGVKRTSSNECKIEWTPSYNVNVVLGCLVTDKFEWSTQTIVVLGEA